MSRDTNKQKFYKLYFDGSCGPKNPGGDLGFAFILRDSNNNEIKRFSKQIKKEDYIEGVTSNNLAEYLGLISGLEYLLESRLHLERIYIYGDSSLVINQMNGYWGIKDGLYRYAAERAILLVKKFLDIRFKFIKREFNRECDIISKYNYREVDFYFLDCD